MGAADQQQTERGKDGCIRLPLEEKPKAFLDQLFSRSALCKKLERNTNRHGHSARATYDGMV